MRAAESMFILKPGCIWWASASSLVSTGTSAYPASSKRFSEQRAIVCQTAAPLHIFPYRLATCCPSYLPLLKRRQCFADDNLCRETDVIMYILFSKTDGFFSSHYPMVLALDSLCGKCRRHDTGRTRERYSALVRLVLFGSSFVNFTGYGSARAWYLLRCILPFPAHLYRLYRRSGHGSPRGPCTSLSSTFRMSGVFTGDFLHHTDNLIG